MREERAAGLKRIACQIAAQLPDDPEEAAEVLEFALGIVKYLARPPASTVRLAASRQDVLAAVPTGEAANRT